MMAALTCPLCGISFAEFREAGRFGCPNDCTEFFTELLPLLENFHEDTRHTGKSPKSTRLPPRDQNRMIQLRKQLQDAVECEDYETAARMRDEIAGLEAAVHPAKPADLPTSEPATSNSKTSKPSTTAKRKRTPKPDGPKE